MARRADKAPSQRQLRVGEELRHALAWVLERGDLRDPGLQEAPVTVTEVRVSGDLRVATAYVVPLGGGDVATVVQALERATPFLRRHVGRAVKLRFVPELKFRADDSFDRADHIETLLSDPRVARDLERGPGDGEDHGT